jgi:hypothetical protein
MQAGEGGTSARECGSAIKQQPQIAVVVFVQRKHATRRQAIASKTGERRA